MRTFILVLSLSMLLPACEDKQPAPSTSDEVPQSGGATSGSTPSGNQQQTELDIPKRAEPIEGITTGAQPDQKTLESLDENGFSTVINLRTAGEHDAFDEGQVVEAQGLAYVNIPISGPQDLTRENAELLDKTLENAAPGKILVHCGSSNRVGALLALRARWIEHKSIDEALALGRAAGLTELESAVVERLGDGFEADSAQ